MRQPRADFELVHSRNLEMEITPAERREYQWVIEATAPGEFEISVAQAVGYDGPFGVPGLVQLDGRLTSIGPARDEAGAFPPRLHEVFDVLLVDVGRIEHFARALLALVAEARARHPELRVMPAVRK